MAQVVQGSRQWSAGPGQALLLPPDWQRLQGFSPSTRILSLSLDVTTEDGRHLPLLTEAVLLPDGPAAALAAAGRLVLRRQNGAGASLAAWCGLRSALYGFAGQIIEQADRLAGIPAGPDPVDPRTARLAALLASSTRLGPLDHALLAAGSGLGRRQLDRLCRRQFGASPRVLRDRAVLVRARELLADPRRNLEGVAAELGCHDASHFVKWFRRQCGRTPGEERRLAAGV